MHPLLNRLSILIALIGPCFVSITTQSVAIAENLNSPYQQCIMNRSGPVFGGADAFSTPCMDLRALVAELETARSCILHERKVINMSNYSPAICKNGRIRRLINAAHGNYSSVALAPLRFPEGSEPLDFTNGQQQEESSNRYKIAFSDSFTDAVRINGKELSASKTEATFYIEKFCVKSKFAPMQQIVYEIKSLSQYAALYSLSCKNNSKLRFHARPVVSVPM